MDRSCENQARDLAGARLVCNSSVAGDMPLCQIELPSSQRHVSFPLVLRYSGLQAHLVALQREVTEMMGRRESVWSTPCPSP